jgi:Tat protein secretion system quality control protein TatD with DNase activity
MIPSVFKDKKRSKPSYISATINYIAELRGVSSQIVAEFSYRNAKNIFNILK